MKLSIFTTITEPLKRQDPFFEAIDCYTDLADEVVIVDGATKVDSDELKGLLERLPEEKLNKIKWVYYEWPDDFEWPFIGQQFQRGYEACTGDWVIRCDLDYFFHENDISKIRHKLKEMNNTTAVSFWKYQFLLVDRYNIKSRTVMAVNKRLKGHSIKFNSGGDLCQPSIDGIELKADNLPEIRLPFYNYDFCFKEKGVIEKDWKRFRGAWHRCFGSDFGEFKSMMVGRFNGREFKKVGLDEHPKYVRAIVNNITSKQFGHSMFGWVKEKVNYREEND